LAHSQHCGGIAWVLKHDMTEQCSRRPFWTAWVRWCKQMLSCTRVQECCQQDRDSECSPCRAVVPNGVSTGLDIGLSNYSLMLITLSFYTMCKSATPVFLLVFAFVWGLERCARVCRPRPKCDLGNAEQQAQCSLHKPLVAPLLGLFMHIAGLAIWYHRQSVETHHWVYLYADPAGAWRAWSSSLR